MQSRPGADIDPRRPAADAVEADLEAYRKELTGYCYRMLGSGFEAEDAAQETMVRAWQHLDRFEGRAALRSWLYRIATNVCLDMLRGPQRRARPMDLGPSAPADSSLGPIVPEHAWVQPVPDSRVLSSEGDPAELAASRESVRLAFVAALQHLPARQRAVLILREVLRWHADEVAELLDTSVASVNSALQRARATLATLGLDDATGPSQVDPDQQELLARYVDAFERYDVTSIVRLLHDEAAFTMPPYTLWLSGPTEIGRFYLGQGIGCRGSRLLPTSANGCPAFGAYKPSGPDTLDPWAIQVIETEDGRITGLHHFIYPELFEAFGLPARVGR
ncbi:MAG TPA: sigma-70 family RNA polymerase sigma factor [Acidimicrobiales bacterium]